MIEAAKKADHVGRIGFAILIVSIDSSVKFNIILLLVPPPGNLI